MKRAKLFLVLFVLLFALVGWSCSMGDPQDVVIVDQGICGDHLQWTYDQAGKLRIFGEGQMDDFLDSVVPWESYRNGIYTVEIGDNVTSICNRAFRDCPELTFVDIPGSVTQIGAYAFAQCSKLSKGWR